MELWFCRLYNFLIICLECTSMYTKHLVSRNGGVKRICLKIDFKHVKRGVNWTDNPLHMERKVFFFFEIEKQSIKQQLYYM